MKLELEGEGSSHEPKMTNVVRKDEIRVRGVVILKFGLK